MDRTENWRSERGREQPHFRGRGRGESHRGRGRGGGLGHCGDLGSRHTENRPRSSYHNKKTGYYEQRPKSAVTSSQSGSHDPNYFDTLAFESNAPDSHKRKIMARKLNIAARNEIITEYEELKFLKSYLISLENEEKCQSFEKLERHYRVLTRSVTAVGKSDDFCIEIYEKAVSVALNAQAFDQFLVYVSQLLIHYSVNCPKDTSSWEECLAMHLLYFVCVRFRPFEVSKALLRMSADRRKSEPVQFALIVLRAVANHDYVKFFRLLEQASGRIRQVMAECAGIMRKNALVHIAKSYNQLQSRYIQKILGYQTAEECEQEFKNVLPHFVFDSVVKFKG